MKTEKTLNLKQWIGRHPLFTVLAVIVILYAGYLFGHWVNMVVN